MRRRTKKNGKLQFHRGAALLLSAILAVLPAHAAAASGNGIAAMLVPSLNPQTAPAETSEPDAAQTEPTETSESETTETSEPEPTETSEPDAAQTEPTEISEPETTETSEPESTETSEWETAQPEDADAAASDASSAGQAYLDTLLEKVAQNTGTTRWDEAENARRADRTGVIPANISIEGTSVGGMTVDEAEQVVQQYISGYEGVTFTLQAEDRQLQANTTDVGLAARNDDVALEALHYGQQGNLFSRYQESRNIANGVNKDFNISLTSTNLDILWYLSDHAAELNRDPVEYTLSRENGAFIIHGGDTGLAVDVGKSVTAVADYINSDWSGGDAVIPLVTEVTYPVGDRESLASVQDLLGSYSTTYTSWATGRNQNIAAATRLCNGTVLFPGQVFSAYQAMSPMDEAHGYTTAGGYENGQVVDVIGGGVCQASTTLYNAVMRAELEIVTRSCHSMIVDYVKPSMDAAIAGDYKDFQFRNNTDYPVYIEGYAGGGTVSFNVFGKETRPASRSVSFESEVVSEDPYEVKYVMSDAFDAGSVQRTQSAHTGYVARLWKIVRENGVETERYVYNNSRYNRTDAVITIGTAGMSAEGRNAIAEAIATGSDATIRNTAAQYTASAEAYRQQQRAAEAAQQAASSSDDSDSGSSDTSGSDSGSSSSGSDAGSDTGSDSDADSSSGSDGSDSE